MALAAVQANPLCSGAPRGAHLERLARTATGLLEAQLLRPQTVPSRRRIFSPALVMGLVLLGVVVVVAWLVVVALLNPQEESAGGGGGWGRGGGGRGSALVPVEVAEIERGPLEQRRTFSGTISPRAEASVAPKISGRIQRLTVNLGDVVDRGQIVAELDSAEAQQAVAQVEAELAVAKANVAQAESALGTAIREYERVQTLRERGVASESQLDVAAAERDARQAEQKVAEAEVRQAEASLEAAKIRLGYTKVEATWADGDEQRVVAERFVDAGDTVGANTPLLRVVQLDPLDAIIFITERDYARLNLGQAAMIQTDAYPGEDFVARVVRMAPVFRQASRQARIELEVSNPEHRLKPGMFARVTIVLDRLEDATIIPVRALLSREGQEGIFVVDDSNTARFVPVEVHIRTATQAAVSGEGLAGRVVTLGQQLLEDGSAVTIPEDEEAALPATGESRRQGGAP